MRTQTVLVRRCIPAIAAHIVPIRQTSSPVCVRAFHSGARYRIRVCKHCARRVRGPTAVARAVGSNPGSDEGTGGPARMVPRSDVHVYLAQVGI